MRHLLDTPTTTGWSNKHSPYSAGRGQWCGQGKRKKTNLLPTPSPSANCTQLGSCHKKNKKNNITTCLTHSACSSSTLLDSLSCCVRVLHPTEPSASRRHRPVSPPHPPSRRRRRPRLRRCRLRLRRLRSPSVQPPPPQLRPGIFSRRRRRSILLSAPLEGSESQRSHTTHDNARPSGEYSKYLYFPCQLATRLRITTVHRQPVRKHRFLLAFIRRRSGRSQPDRPAVLYRASPAGTKGASLALLDETAGRRRTRKKGIPQQKDRVAFSVRTDEGKGSCGEISGVLFFVRFPGRGV